MVNCVCQLDWIMGCPDIWLQVSGYVWIKSTLELMGSVCPLQCGWASCNPLRA